MTGVAKKVMVVIPTLSGGGAERVATTLLHAMPNMVLGLEQVVVLFGTGNDVSLPAATRVRFLGMTHNKSFIATVLRFFRLVFRLVAVIREERPDSILSFMDYTNVVVILAKRLAGVKSRLVVSVRTRPSAQTREHAANRWEYLVGILIGRLYRLPDAIIAVSRDVAADLVKNFNVSPQLVKVINNPIDVERIARLAIEEVSEAPFDEQGPILLSVGRLSKEKGHDTLLRAFALIAGQTSARLVLVGEGGEEQSLRRLAAELGVAKRVFFLGYQINPYKFMQHSTVFILSSVYEGFVNVVVEAMACGLPVVATRASADIGDVVADGESGLLVPVGDKEAISAAVLRLLYDPALCKAMGDQGRKRVKKFAVEKIAEQYVAELRLLSKQVI